jgi:hypothetical protein
VPLNSCEFSYCVAMHASLADFLIDALFRIGASGPVLLHFAAFSPANRTERHPRLTTCCDATHLLFFY